MNKKANLGEFLPYMLVGLVITLIFAIVAIPMAEVGDQIFDSLKETDNLGSQNNTVNSINTVQGLMTIAFDQVVTFILVGFLLGIIVLAIFTDFHPVTVAMMVIFLIIMVIVAALFSNVYDDFTSDDSINSKASEFTFTSALMGYTLPILVVVVFIVAIVIVLGKRGSTAPV